MASIVIDSFAGERPKVAPRLLPEYGATRARNCLTNTGDLRPIEGPITMGVPVEQLHPSIQTLFLYSPARWFNWPEVVNVVRSPIAQDPYGRIYYTGDGRPKVTTNAIATGAGKLPRAAYDLGVPAPTQQPLLVYLNKPSDDDGEYDDDETRFYCYTYVTSSGEEGPASPVSTRLEMKRPDVDEVAVTVYPPKTDTHDVSAIRIYRSATGAEDTQFQFVTEVALANATVTDALKADQLGPPLATDHLIPPPGDMHGLISVPGGFLMGFAGNTICPSEPYLPYGYPDAYRLTTEHDIVAGVAIGAGVVVTTTGYPYLISGISPDSLSPLKLDLEQACVSARSLVALDGMAVYASPDGLVGVTSNGATLLTGEVMTQKQWQALRPETIHAYQHESQYVGFLGPDRGGFIFDPTNGDLRFFDLSASAGYRDLESDALYLVVAGDVVKWRGGDAQAFEWQSREYHSAPVGFGWLKVRPAAAAPTVNLVVDGKPFFTCVPDPGTGLSRLPPGQHQTWQINVTGSVALEGVALAQSLDELAL